MFRNPDDEQFIEAEFAGQGPRPFGAIAAEIVADQRTVRTIGAVHHLGERVLIEAVAEIGARMPAAWPVVIGVFERFSMLDPDLLRAVGADHLPPRPLSVIEGSRRQ